MRLLDTVFFSPETPLSESTWLFTSKHGTVTLKKQEQVTAPKIIERFTRFALMNPLNVDEIVGTSISASAGTKSLGATDLEALLEQQQQRRQQQQAGTSEAVQVYLRPRGGAEETFIVEYTAEAYGEPTLRLKRRLGGVTSGQSNVHAFEEALPPNWDPEARADMEAAVRCMVCAI